MIADGLAELAARRAEIDERAAPFREAADESDEDAMTAPFEILEGIDVRHAGGGWYQLVDRRSWIVGSNRTRPTIYDLRSTI